MNIAITGANSMIGRALLARLSTERHRTVALTRTEQALPAHRVITDWPISADAHRELREAEVVVHLCGELRPGKPNSYQRAQVETAATVADALKAGWARRVIAVSHVLADRNCSNEYLRTKAEADRLLVASGKEAVILRGATFLGSPECPGGLEQALTAKGGAPVRLLGNGSQVQQPIYRGDVVSAILAALTIGRPGQYELVGPLRMTADELVRLVNRRPDVRIAHTPAWLARVASSLVPGLPKPFVDLMLRDSVGDPAPLCREFGLTLTCLRTLWS